MAASHGSAMPQVIQASNIQNFESSNDAAHSVLRSIPALPSVFSWSGAVAAQKCQRWEFQSDGAERPRSSIDAQQGGNLDARGVAAADVPPRVGCLDVPTSPYADTELSFVLSPSVCGGSHQDDAVAELRARCTALESEGFELREQLVKMEDASEASRVAVAKDSASSISGSSNTTEALRSELQAMMLQAERERKQHAAEVAALKLELARASGCKPVPSQAPCSETSMPSARHGAQGRLLAGNIVWTGLSCGATEHEGNDFLQGIDFANWHTSPAHNSQQIECSPPRGHMGGSVTPRLHTSDGATGGAPTTPNKTSDHALPVVGASPSQSLALSLSKSHVSSPATCLRGTSASSAGFDSAGTTASSSVTAGLRAMNQQRSPQTPIATCPQGHKLQLAACRPGATWVCDGCDKDDASFTIGARYRCLICDYDLCVGCRSRQGNAQAFGVTCPAGHILRGLPSSPAKVEEARWVCDGCETMGNFLCCTTRYRCTPCDFDLCDKCHGARRVRLGQLFAKGDRRTFGAGAYPADAGSVAAIAIPDVAAVAGGGAARSIK